ncbi:putative nucleic acid-binding protein [Spirosoma sp. LMG 31447]|uniref:Nucleic acid-binding protein n=1 Tax=Spirosoma utsteinense TaxID=2585773 RepID=A0ABR6WAS8_9BACT|nr:putative nucleic acid-binding protein [Spirosoma utsteinense]
MLVISDTSPITNLIQIGHLDLLRQVFGQVILPRTVYDELGELPR